MITHNLILRSDRCTIPSNENLHKFVEERLENPTVEYFGLEIDNDIDFADEEMIKEIEGSCYIKFHFNHPTDLDQQTAIDFVKYALKEDKAFEFVADEKDIEVVIL